MLPFLVYFVFRLLNWDQLFVVIDNSLLKFYLSKKLIGPLVQNNTLTAWLSFDFNSYSFGHKEKKIILFLLQSICHVLCLCCTSWSWWKLVWLFENIVTWHCILLGPYEVSSMDYSLQRQFLLIVPVIILFLLLLLLFFNKYIEKQDPDPLTFKYDLI